MNSPNLYSLHIGVGETAEYTGPPLLFPEGQTLANEMAIWAKKNGYCAKPLLNKDATRANVLNQLAFFEEEMEEEDLLIITYAGHGFIKPKKSLDDPLISGYLALYDGYLLDDYYSNFFRFLKKKTGVIIFMDCCFGPEMVDNKKLWINKDNAWTKQLNTVSQKYYNTEISIETKCSIKLYTSDPKNQHLSGRPDYSEAVLKAWKKADKETSWGDLNDLIKSSYTGATFEPRGNTEWNDFEKKSIINDNK